MPSKKKLYVVKSNLLTCEAEQHSDSVSLLKNAYLSIDNGTIADISENYNNERGELLDLSDKIIVPGLIDAHTHLPQLPIVGKYGNTLIEWLERYTYPAEARFNDPKYARALSKRYFDQLKQNGITTAVIYSSSNMGSTQIAFTEAEKSGIRVFLGNTMMDQNCPSDLCQSTLTSLVESNRMAQAYNCASDRNQKINYIFSPRFAITCTEGLLEETASLAKKTDSYIQTHLSESISEVRQTEQLFSTYNSYTDMYLKTGILGSKTLLAHCLHCTDEELDIISKSSSKIVHCPDSNLFLQSGRFPIERIKERGITFGLGSDVGAGTTMNMFKIMKSMIYMQSISEKYSVTPFEAFYTATVGNAEIIGLSDKIGSIEVGKNAELTVLTVDSPSILDGTAEEVLSELIFSESITNMESLM